MNPLERMRWRLGQSTAKKKAAVITPRGVDVAPTNQASSTTTTTSTAADAGTDWERSGGPSDAHETSTTQADIGDDFYYATASCLSLRRRAANSARANGARIRTTDGLTSSFASFVEGLGSQPRRQPSSAENAHFSPSSTVRARPDDDGGSGANVSCGGGGCGGGADNALLDRKSVV